MEDLIKREEEIIKLADKYIDERYKLPVELSSKKLREIGNKEAIAISEAFIAGINTKKEEI